MIFLGVEKWSGCTQPALLQRLNKILFLFALLYHFRMLIIKLVLLLVTDKCIKVVADNFYEDLLVSNLDDGSIYSLFQFTTNLEKNIFEDELCKYNESLFFAQVCVFLIYHDKRLVVC